MGSNVSECKPKQAWPRHKRVEKDVLPAAGKKSMGVISKYVPTLNGGSWAFYLGAYTYSYRKYFMSGRI
jgi:hypothetical protein